MKTKTASIVLACFLVMTAISMAGAGEDYPNKQVQLICPYAVGGITDLSARILAEKMGEFMGQPVIAKGQNIVHPSLMLNYATTSVTRTRVSCIHEPAAYRGRIG
jgi:predicted secreted Zn-dependent protease